MAITNHERVGTAMELLRQGLAPFVERELNDKVKRNAVDMDVLRRFEIDKPYPRVGRRGPPPADGG